MRGRGVIALIAVDVQNDFSSTGALAVKGGEEVVRPLNRIIKFVKRMLGVVVLTRDWHPKDSVHFKKWPEHCVQHTYGAEFIPGIETQGVAFISKGAKADEDVYSGFAGTYGDGRTLNTLLYDEGVTSVLVGGLATDYCVKETALDAVKYGFKTYLLRDASRAVNIKPDDEDKAIAEMKAAGVIITTVAEVLRW